MHGLAYILNLFFLNCSISWPINKEAFIIHVLLMCTNYISVFWWVCKELQNSNLDQEIYMGLQCIVATKLRGIKKTWRRNYKSVWKIFLNNSQESVFENSSQLFSEQNFVWNSIWKTVFSSYFQLRYHALMCNAKTFVMFFMFQLFLITL